MRTFKIKWMKTKDQVYLNLKTVYTRTPIYSSQSNKASVLGHIVSIFSIYYVDYNCMIVRSVMIGLTRIVVSFLEALE
jgi:hypothetical protein